jgi:2-iminobutanoate/2-iminopropanoate deaminase
MSSQPEYHTLIPNLPTPVGPYSHAVTFQGMVFLSGQIGIDPKLGVLVSGGLEAELEQILKNIHAALMHVGSSVDRILMTTIFLTDMQHYAQVNKKYGEWVSSAAHPARQTIAVKELPAKAAIEISIIAAQSIPDKKARGRVLPRNKSDEARESDYHG